MSNKNRDAGAKQITGQQIETISAFFENDLGRNQKLLEEVVYILTERTKSEGLKIHAIEKRIKDLPSIIAKCQRDGLTDLGELKDIIGARVVCLFRSDLDRVGKLIEKNFDVIEVDDKLSVDNNPLGYLSVHYSCKIPSRYRGPRYEATAGVIFEIQVRTLCMHAWAAVSHYLDYKGDWDVPTDLKRALSALSGLFYVADNEFEQFYAERLSSQKNASLVGGMNTSQEINLDTISAYLHKSFPDRQQDTEHVSELVLMLKEAGYKTIAQVERDVGKASVQFARFEKDHPAESDEDGPPRKIRYTAAGMVRLSIAIVSERFMEIHLKQNGVKEVADYK